MEEVVEEEEEKEMERGMTRNKEIHVYRTEEEE